MADIQAQMNNAIKKMGDATKNFAEIGGMSVEVGLPSDRIHEPSGLPLAELGAIHEFGLDDIPERSFLRSVVIIKKAEIQKAMTVQSKKAANGEDANKLMEQFALFGQGLVQENIVDLSQPPLKSPRKDGSTNPLNDSGAMKQGVIGVVVSD